MKAGGLRGWTRGNLSMQGYEGLSDEERRQLGLALRLSPSLCLAGIAAGVVFESAAILLAMAATAFVGGFVAAKHPFDLLWDNGLRRLLGGPPLPLTPAPRRFACQIATPWLVAMAVAYIAGWQAVGVGLGIPLLLVAAVNATTNWCLPSLVYRLGTARLRSRAA